MELPAALDHQEIITARRAILRTDEVTVRYQGSPGSRGTFDGVPSEARMVLPVTQRTICVATTIREEILLAGHANRNNHATLRQLDGRLLAWMKYLCIQYPGWWLDGVFGQVSHNDRSLIALPEKLQFLYHVIRPARLLVKHIGRAYSTLRDRVSLTCGTVFYIHITPSYPRLLLLEAVDGGRCPQLWTEWT